MMGVAYGNIRSFKLGSQVVKDRDGNIYHAVSIGTQVWLSENLRTTTFRDSTTITLSESSSQWGSLAGPGYCWYNNDPIGYKSTYGALYNWQAVASGKLCPTGWHVPSDTDWITLIDHLGGTSQAGGKLKESGTEHWKVPNAGATNEVMFTALREGIGLTQVNIPTWEATVIGGALQRLIPMWPIIGTFITGAVLLPQVLSVSVMVCPSGV